MMHEIFTLAATTPEPWFNPAMAGAIAGSCGGIYGGLYGCLVGVCAPRGVAKPLILGLHFFGLLAGFVMLAAGIVALATDQPYGVWFALGLTGVVMTTTLGFLTPVVLIRYREADQRQLEAEEFKRAQA